jgi:hypothetical protein
VGKDFLGHARGGPRINAARRDQAAVGVTRFLRDVVVPFDDDDFVTCLRKKECGADTNDSTADYCNLLCHLTNL